FEGSSPRTAALSKNPPGGVEPQQIYRNSHFTEFSCQLYYISIGCFGFMSPGTAAVCSRMQSQGKLRQQGRFARKCSVCCKDCRKIRSIHKIVIQFAVNRLKTIAFFIRPSHVPFCRERVMEKYAVPVGTHKKRHWRIIGFKDIVSSDLMRKAFSPADIQKYLFPPLVHKVHAFAETKKMLIRLKFFCTSHRFTFLNRPSIYSGF